MNGARLRVIATLQIETDVLAIEEVPSQREVESGYTTPLRRLVREQRAEFKGRAIDEETGVAYQVFNVPGDADTPAQTILVHDASATKVIATLLDGEGAVRKLRVVKGAG